MTPCSSGATPGCAPSFLAEIDNPAPVSAQKVCRCAGSAELPTGFTSSTSTLRHVTCSNMAHSLQTAADDPRARTRERSAVCGRLTAQSSPVRKLHADQKAGDRRDGRDLARHAERHREL